MTNDERIEAAANAMPSANQQPTGIVVTVIGDCGRVHPSFESWQKCSTCGAILESRLRNVHLSK